MNKYELALVVNAKIDDDARAAVVEKGKQKLAYEIQKMNEGYYYFIPFDAEPTVPAVIEADVRIMDNVLRFLIVRKDEE